MKAIADRPFRAKTNPNIPAESLFLDVRLRPTYRPDIDGLRALAIIPVVIFHAFPTIIPGGFVGVDIFFVISGFLISNIILQGLIARTFTFAGFYANRIRRIFPALVVVLAACFAFGWFFLLPEEYRQLGKHIVGAAAYFENFVLRREAGYFDVGSYLKPLMHLWSLGIEEQFYLAYPLFLWLVWRFRRNPFAALLVIGFFSFGLNVWLVRRDPVGAFFLPQTRAWELVAGGALSCLQLFREDARHAVSGPLNFIRLRSFHDHDAFLRRVASVTGLTLIVIALWRVHETDQFPGWLALLPVCGASLLIWSGPGSWINRKILANKWMVLVGLMSYPLYLWHWPVLTFPRVIRGSELPAAVRVFGVFLSVGLAWATWRFIENPIRFGRKTWLKPVALLASSAVVGSLGYAAHRDGFIGRFSNYLGDLGRPMEVQWSTPQCGKGIGLSRITYCRISGDAPPDIVLIGDSHAGALYDAWAAGYRARSQVVMNLGEAGCVPFYDTDSFSAGVRHEDCRPVTNRVLDFAASSTSVHTIILSFRGPLYMSGHGFAPAEMAGPPKTIMWDGAPRNLTQPEVFTAAFRKTIARLSASGKSLILILDWPELDFDPDSCLPRPVTVFSSPRSYCGVPRKQVDTRHRGYRAAAFQLTKEFERLKLFDPFPYLCDATECYAMRSGHPFYSDDNHLSDAGVAYLSQKFFAEQFPSAVTVGHAR